MCAVDRTAPTELIDELGNTWEYVPARAVTLDGRPFTAPVSVYVRIEHRWQENTTRATLDGPALVRKPVRYRVRLACADREEVAWVYRRPDWGERDLDLRWEDEQQTQYQATVRVDDSFLRLHTRLFVLPLVVRGSEVAITAKARPVNDQDEGLSHYMDALRYAWASHLDQAVLSRLNCGVRTHQFLDGVQQGWYNIDSPRQQGKTLALRHFADYLKGEYEHMVKNTWYDVPTEVTFTFNGQAVPRQEPARIRCRTVTVGGRAQEQTELSLSAGALILRKIGDVSTSFESALALEQEGFTALRTLRVKLPGYGTFTMQVRVKERIPHPTQFATSFRVAVEPGTVKRDGLSVGSVTAHLSLSTGEFYDVLKDLTRG